MDCAKVIINHVIVHANSLTECNSENRFIPEFLTALLTKGRAGSHAACSALHFWFLFGPHGIYSKSISGSQRAANPNRLFLFSSLWFHGWHFRPNAPSLGALNCCGNKSHAFHPVLDRREI